VGATGFSGGSQGKPIAIMEINNYSRKKNGPSALKKAKENWNCRLQNERQN
jgi:hypothetical protein